MDFLYWLMYLGAPLLFITEKRQYRADSASVAPDRSRVHTIQLSIVIIGGLIIGLVWLFVSAIAPQGWTLPQFAFGVLIVAWIIEIILYLIALTTRIDFVYETANYLQSLACATIVGAAIRLLFAAL